MITQLGFRPSARYEAATALLSLPSIGEIRLPARSLQELGRLLDDLIAEWKPLHRKMKECSDLWHEMAEKEGVDPGGGNHRTDDVFERYWEICRLTGAEAAINEEQKLCERIDTVNKQIRAQEVQCMADLIVWGKALRFDCLSFETITNSDEEIEWPDECLIRFLEQLERVSGGVS